MRYNSLETSRITLRPIDESDYPVLHKWRNEFRFLNLFSARREVVSFDDFLKEIKAELSRNRHLQFIVELKKNKAPIGTIYSFNLSPIDGYVFVNIYIESEYENKGYGAEAVTLIVCYLFEFFPIRKICFEAFEYNNLSLSTLKKGTKYGLCMEGIFKGHRFYKGLYHDVFRFAIHRNSLEKIACLLKRFNSRKDHKSLTDQ